MAEENLLLTCSISLPSGLIGTPSFNWTGPKKSYTATLDTHEGMFFSTLMLNGILPGDAGMYTCTVILGGSLNDSINVTLLGECESEPLRG